MTLPDASGRAQALARSYGGDRDGWERVVEYQRVMAWQGEHPQKGSQAAATALNLPRGRVRPWLDDTMPDAMRVINIAQSRG